MAFNKYLLGAVAAISVTAFLSASASATSTSIPDHKIGICHATGSAKNPYVFIIVDKHAADAHARHQDGKDIVGVKSAAACPKSVSDKKPAATPKPTPAGAVLGSSTAKTEDKAPTTLPETGAGLSTLIGLPTMLLAGTSYLRSRRHK